MMRREGYALVVMLAAFGTACGSAGGIVINKSGTSETDVVNALWAWNRQPILLAIASSQDVDLGQFQRAVEFFERTTGIQYEEGSFVGKLPGRGLKEALDKWEAWFKANSSRLSLDPDSCRLRVNKTE